jgi:alkaline phosphatase D
MQPISRRAFLVSAATVVIAGCSDSAKSSVSTFTPASGGTTSAATGSTTSATTSPVPAVDLPGDPFTLGIASGDPDATSVVLWTRLAPDPLNGGGMPDGDIGVLWEVSASPEFEGIASSGITTATAGHGHTVHEIVPLDAGDWYYRFRVGDYTSPTGLTRRAPAPGEGVEGVRFAAASCQDYADGQYAAHRDIAEQRPEFLVWLGDYIYESAGADGADPADRVHLGPEPTDLVTYRNRYARYKTDAHLQASHATCPWFVIWDDHEVENNYAGLSPQDPADAAGFAERRAAAYQAWWEHQPTRLHPPTGAGEYRIYRDAQWGDLIELALLDGRQYRSDQACGDATLSLAPACPETTDPTRTMLGDEQEQWLLDTLAASSAAWNVVGNQVVLADATVAGAVLNYDQWDGYPVARARLLQAFADRGIDNLVVITGDIHLAAVAQLRAGDRATGTDVGVEFVTTSISSEGLVGEGFGDVLKAFPDLIDAELAHRGYVLHTVTRQVWSAEYRIVTDVSSADSEVTTYGTYEVQTGTNKVTTS